MSEVPAVSLAEVIRQLRGDLHLAAWQGEGKDPTFEVGPIELELSVVVDAKRSGGAKAGLWVIDASAEIGRSTQVTHRIKVTLQPVDNAGNRSKISGPALPGEEDPA